MGLRAPGLKHGPRLPRGPWGVVALALAAALALAVPALNMLAPSTAAHAQAEPGAVAPISSPDGAYTVTEPAFQRYYAERGGLASFGYPASNSFRFQGFTIQIFQRRVMQLAPDGSARLLNLLDDGLLPYTRFNGSVFPAADPSLALAAPRPDAPDYAQAVLAFVQAHAPDSFAGHVVNFYQTFASAVSCQQAFPDGACNPALLPLMDLELWGVPTSAPQSDPGNPSFIYQRFQRGIMHYDAGCECTQGILLGDYFAAVLSGQNLPADLLAQVSDSPLYGATGRGLPDSAFAASGLPVFSGSIPPADVPSGPPAVARSAQEQAVVARASPPSIPPASTRTSSGAGTTATTGTASIDGGSGSGTSSSSDGGGGNNNSGAVPVPPPPLPPTAVPPIPFPPTATPIPPAPTAIPSPTPVLGSVALALSPADGTVPVGGTVQLALTLDSGSQPVDGLQLHLAFDPAVLQVVDDSGAPATSLPASTTLTFPLLNQVDNTAGHIDYAAGQLAAPFPVGSLAVTHLTFRALAASGPQGTTLSFETAAGRAPLATFAGSSLPVLAPTGATLLVTP